jgi:hypothetical protein
MIEVWKQESREYYTRILKARNAYGQYETACSRKVVFWCARKDGKIVRGCATRREALAAFDA